MKKQIPILGILLIALCSSLNVSATIRLPRIISNHMVLQQQSKVNLWGTSDTEGIVEVKPSWSYETYKAVINKEGKWKANIPTPSAGGPYTITLKDKTEKLTLTDILIGEVWLCSGQSNMEMPVKGFFAQPVLTSTETITQATESTPIRIFNVEKEGTKVPMNDLRGEWLTHTPVAVANTSAAAYFFGQQLYHSLGNIPIGLIHSSWGASAIEAWMSPEALKLFPEISLKHLSNNEEVKNKNHAGAMLYNAMLYPLHNFGIKGVIWYQGEKNRLLPKQYEHLMASFVGELRQSFNQAELPFYYVQIAPFGYHDKEAPFSGAEIREAQLNVEATLPYSGMAVLMDIGEERCIHPANKQAVGQRLAYLALNKTYGKEAIPAFSPRFAKQKQEGNKLILSFTHAEMGLSSFGKPLKEFEIAGEDKQFVPAKATIIRGKEVQVWSDAIPQPRYVRYAYKNYVVGDLFGVNGLPVSSFRTM